MYMYYSMIAEYLCQYYCIAYGGWRRVHLCVWGGVGGRKLRQDHDVSGMLYGACQHGRKHRACRKITITIMG